MITACGPISSDELTSLVDLELSDDQIAKYFGVEQVKVSALRAYYPRFYPKVATVIETAMSEKMPLITGVKRRAPGSLTEDGFAIVVCEVETADGNLLLQLTPNAAHELNALLDKLPPRITPVVSIKLFE